MPLDEASESAPVGIMIPHHALANPENSTGAEICTSEVLLHFDTGVIILFDDESPKDPKALLEQIAAEDERLFTAEVRGQTALLIEPSGQGPDDALGGLTFYENGMLIEVAGNGLIPLEDLVAVAESLAKAEPESA